MDGNASLLLNRRRLAPRQRQGGIVLIVALLVLVAVSLAAVSIMRSVDTATLVAGNLAFQQAATRAGDKGIEQAISVIQAKSTAGTLHVDDPTNGYFATMRQTDSPTLGTTWQSFWHSNYTSSSVVMPKDQFDNQVSFVIHRECATPAPAGAGGQCVASPAVTKATGNSQEAGELELNASSAVYYRITVRVSGPRRTESYVQSHIAL